jgi:homoserine kinase
MRHEERLCAETAEPLPPFALHGVNRIPLERGLGSSSAAVVAGLLAAAKLLDVGRDSSPFDLLVEAAAIEGHPDNAAPALYGGFTIVYLDGPGPPIRLDPHPELKPVVLVPATRLATPTARGALKGQVSLADAVFTGAHAAAVAVAITQDPALLFGALEDRLHQDTRLDLAPASREAFEALRSSSIPACVSGAGPSLLAFERPPHQLPDLGERWRVLPLAPDLNGAQIL